jgi:hypothetical protein
MTQRISVTEVDVGTSNAKCLSDKSLELYGRCASVKQATDGNELLQSDLATGKSSTPSLSLPRS